MLPAIYFTFTKTEKQSFQEDRAELMKLLWFQDCYDSSCCLQIQCLGCKKDVQTGVEGKCQRNVLAVSSAPPLNVDKSSVNKGGANSISTINYIQIKNSQIPRRALKLVGKQKQVGCV